MRNVGAVTKDFQQIKPNEAILAQREAIAVRQPLHDQIVSLFLSKVKGDPPQILKQEKGRPDSVGGGVIGDLESQEFLDEAQQLLNRYYDHLQAKQRCNKPYRKNSLSQLIFLTEKCVQSGGALSDAELSRLRTLIARFVSRRGIPGSDAHQALRARQRQQIDIPIFAELARVVDQAAEVVRK